MIVIYEKHWPADSIRHVCIGQKSQPVLYRFALINWQRIAVQDCT